MPDVTRRGFIESSLAAGAGALVADGLTPARAQAAERPDRMRHRSVRFTEGTNMSVAVSPSGTRLVVEVQGILYGLDAAGGRGKQLTPWQLEPATPDWSSTDVLTFQAYEGGNFHVWTMGPDGSKLHRWTSGPFDDREPAWSPDGKRIVFCSDRAVGESLQTGSYDIWILDTTTGRIRQVVSGPDEDYMPSWSPDGERIIFVRNGTSVASIAASGHGPVSTLAEVATGGIAYPVLGPDGTPAFVHIGSLEVSTVGAVSRRSTLVVGGEEVTSGEDVEPVPPRWLDAHRLLYVADGAIRERRLGADDVREIPFVASLTVAREKYRKKEYRFDSAERRPVLGIVNPRLSPDGHSVAFHALNALWLMRLGGRPRKLLDSPPQFLLQSLAWSRDGRSLVFSWDRDGLPAIYRYDLASRQTARLTDVAGGQYQGALSPDGRTVAYMNELHALNTVDLASGKVTHLVDPLRGPERVGPPTWSPDSRFIAFNDRQQINGRFREGYNVIRVVEAASGAFELYPPAAYRSISDRGDCGPAWSPDGNWMAFIMESALWVIPVGPTGAPTGVARMLTDEPADSPSWSGDSGTLLYLRNGDLRLIDRAGGDARTVPIDLTWRPQVRSRTEITRIHAGRFWDGTGEHVRRGVDVVIEGSRIKAVTAHRPGADSGERCIDAHDKTVIPGLWECHNHPTFEPAAGGRYLSLYLSYGITTNVSMGSIAYLAISERESLAAGQRFGPRLIATGELIEGSRVSHSPVRAHATRAAVDRTLSRAKALDWDYVKTYVRAPGTMMAHAARFGHRVLGVPSGSHLLAPGYEAGQDMTTHLQATQRLPYGHATSATGQAYEDVREIYTDGGFILMVTPFTAQVLFGVDPALAADPRVQRLMPPWDRAMVVAESKTASTPDAVDALRKEAENYAAILHHGGTVITGTDSPLVPPAVSMHVSLRGLVMHGMTPAEALRTVTSLPARVWGMQDDLGTLEPGKLADLVFVAGNPFANFSDLVNITHVMKGGELFSQTDILDRYPSVSADAPHGHPDRDWLSTGLALRSVGCCAEHLPRLT
jgi:Tol biopolymer transport system component